MHFLAYAMGTGGTGGAEGGQGGAFGAFIPLILMFAIFYFLLIRPQQKKAKEHKSMISAIKKGDRVVSSGGLHGLVTGVTDEAVTMAQPLTRANNNLLATLIAEDLPEAVPQVLRETGP